MSEENKKKEDEIADMSDVEFEMNLFNILNKNPHYLNSRYVDYERTYGNFDRGKIIEALEKPYIYSNQLYLIDASNYFYNMSNEYKRLLKYFAQLPVYSILLKPYNLNTKNVNKEAFKNDYITTARYIKNMNIPHEFQKIFNVIVREDYYFGYKYETKNSFFFRKLRQKYCQVCGFEDGNLRFKFDFSYFDTRRWKVNQYGKFFIDGYARYKSRPNRYRWQEVPLKDSICIKFDQTIDYAIPPFAGIFSSLYDLEDYKKIKKKKEKTNNYKLISLHIPVDDRGNYTLRKDKIIKHIKAISDVLPDNIGVAAGPLKMTEHTFDKAGQSNTDAVSEATEQFWSSAGVSSLLFSSSKSGSSVIEATTAVDAGFIYEVYRQFERWINYQLKLLPYRYKFQVELLDVVSFNKEKVLDMYMKMFANGSPVTMHILSLLGIEANEVEDMLFVENDIFNLREKFIPFASSYTTSNTGGSNSSGRPEKEESDIEEGTEKSRDRKDEGLDE